MENKTLLQNNEADNINNISVNDIQDKIKLDQNENKILNIQNNNVQDNLSQNK